MHVISYCLALKEISNVQQSLEARAVSAALKQTNELSCGDGIKPLRKFDLFCHMVSMSRHTGSCWRYAGLRGRHDRRGCETVDSIEIIIDETTNEWCLALSGQLDAAQASLLLEKRHIVKKNTGM